MDHISQTTPTTIKLCESPRAAGGMGHDYSQFIEAAQ